MPTPDGLNITTIHMKFVEPNSAGTPLSGTITFTPNPSVITFPTQNIIVSGTETATLDVTGQATIDLISTDQTGENPTGWTYAVNEKINGQKPRSYLIALPYNVGVVVELSDITPTDAAPTYLPVTGPQGPPGVITSVNGLSAASITLTPAIIGAVATTARGAANGVASLDAGTKVPVAQLPDLSATYVTTARIGAANGVASLGATSLVPSAQLSLATATPTAIANAGAVGTATNLAREDHTHAGVNLSSAQTVAGVKTWTNNQFITGSQLGVGLSSGLQGRVHLRSVVDEIVLQVDQVTLTGTNPLIGAVGFDTTINAFTAKVTGDTVNRVSIKTSGNIEFGPGSGARDTTFYRSSTGNLNSNQFNADAAAPTATSHLTRKDYVDAADALAVHLAGIETITGAKTFTAVQTLQAVTATVMQQHKVTGDTNNRFQITSDGGLSFGPGNAAVDITVSRSAANTLNINSAFQSTRAAAANPAFAALVSGDTNSRYNLGADGKIGWGPGNAVVDTLLYRSGVGTLATDTALTVGTTLAITTGVTIGGVDTGRGLKTSVKITAPVTIPNGAAGLLVTVPSFTYTNGRAYRFKLFGYASVTTPQTYGLFQFRKGILATGAIVVDGLRISSLPSAAGASDMVISLDVVITNSSGADITTAMNFSGSIASGTGTWDASTTTLPSYITVEDVGLASAWPGAPLT